MNPRSVFAVWSRYLYVFLKNWKYGLVTTFVEPSLYLLSFGFGLGAIIGTVELFGQEIPYRPFVLSGIVAQTLMFQGFFEAAYGGFIRMYYQRIFQAISVTPVTLSEVLWGETFWGATRATASAIAVMIVGIAIEDFDPLSCLALIPVCLAAAMLFSSLGLWVAATASTIEAISYPQYLLIFPMFLFSGVFYPLSNLPEAVQWVARVLPLTPVISLLRTGLLGVPLEIWSPFAILAWILILTPTARRAMIKRLVA